MIINYFEIHFRSKSFSLKFSAGSPLPRNQLSLTSTWLITTGSTSASLRNASGACSPMSGRQLMTRSFTYAGLNVLFHFPKWFG